MKAIRKRSYIFVAFTGFFVLTGAMLLFFGGATSEIQAQMFLASLIIASGILNTAAWN